MGAISRSAIFSRVEPKKPGRKN